MEENEFKLDRTAFSAMTLHEADNHVTYWNNKTEDERLNAACYLINQIFQVTPTTKIDVTITEKRKHKYV
jgi:hypothetical protein